MRNTNNQQQHNNQHQHNNHHQHNQQHHNNNQHYNNQQHHNYGNQHNYYNNYGNGYNYGKNYNKIAGYKKPIQSFGLIPFYKEIITKSTQKDKNDSNPNDKKDTIEGNYNILILLEHRRDTFEYVEFMQGTWRNEDGLPTIFTLMCNDERVRLRNYVFRELWYDLFLDQPQKFHIDKYEKAEQKYESVKEMIPDLIDNTKSSIESPPWSFPKGRKNLQEKDYECAIRETEEEIRIQRSEYKIIVNNDNSCNKNIVKYIGKNCNELNDKDNFVKFSERFPGTNGTLYSTTYYLVDIGNNIKPMPMLTPKCIRKSTFSPEIQDTNWFTIEAASKLLNSRRQTMLLEALNVIKEYYKTN